MVERAESIQQLHLFPTFCGRGFPLQGQGLLCIHLDGERAFEAVAVDIRMDVVLLRQDGVPEQSAQLGNGGVQIVRRIDPCLRPVEGLDRSMPGDTGGPVVKQQLEQLDRLCALSFLSRTGS